MFSHRILKVDEDIMLDLNKSDCQQKKKRKKKIKKAEKRKILKLK